MNGNGLDLNKDKVNRDLSRYSLVKTISLTKYCTVIYLLFGYLSLGTIQKFSKSVGLWDNVWPRFIFVSFPFFLLYTFLKKSGKSDNFKLTVWCISFSIINALSACVYVWPIALFSPQIILYFSSVNNLIFVCTGIYLALPNRIFNYYFVSWTALFFMPLVFLTEGDDAIFSAVVTDIVIYSATLFFLKNEFRKAYQQPIEDKLRHIEASAKFMDEDVNRIFESGGDLDSLSGRKNLFILQMDIRGYTDFLTANDHNDELLRAFSSEVNQLVRGTIKKYKGKTHKTAGDGYLCLFVEQSSTDKISHIDDLREASKAYRANQVTLIVKAFWEINASFRTILKKYNLKQMRVCGAIHFGSALFEFFGDNHRKEYDVVSKNLALAARLEEFTKRLQMTLGPNDYLVISEEVYEYFETENADITISRHIFTGHEGDKIRNFEGIKVVYFITFSSSQVEKESRSAS